MLRLAARIGSRPGMRMPAARASRRVRMGCMRFATHGKFQGMPPGEARLFYLAARRPPLQLQYSLNWRGPIQVMRDLSASLFERVVHTRVMNMVERLYASLAPVLRLGNGRDALQRRIADRWREHMHQPFAAKSPPMHAAAAPGAVFLTEQRARRQGQVLVLAHPPGWRQAPGSVAWPTARPGREMRWSKVRIDSSHRLLRFVLEKLRRFCVSAPDRARRTRYALRYALAGTAVAFGSLLARDPLRATLLSPRATAPSRFFFSLRGVETARRRFRTCHPSNGMDRGHGSVLVRYLRARIGRAARGAGWPPASFAVRGMAPSRLRLAFSRRPFSAWPQTSREGGMFAAALEQAASAKPDIEPSQVDALLRLGHASLKPAGTPINVLASRLSCVFREGARWRTRMSDLARQLLTSSAIGAARPDAAVSAFPWQPARQGRDRSLSRTARAARSVSASRQQGLSLMPPHASRYARQALAALPRGPEPLLATAYTRGNPPPAVMAYRETPRPSELHGTKLMQRIEQQITRRIVHDITQATPWRGDMEKAVLTPRMMRELAEQVGGMLTQRIGLERYRRGL